MRTVIFLRSAELESEQAAIFYNEQQDDLGCRYVATIEEGISRIRFNPFMFPIVHNDVRRCLTRVFPFAILFRIREDVVEVVAVTHLRRNPGYWLDRISLK